MSTDDSSDYALWVALANDPNQSAEARQHYRERMEAHVRRKVREAFQLARETNTCPSSTTDFSQKP
jgi:hypothetical protein